jgi:hypothetical protein
MAGLAVMLTDGVVGAFTVKTTTFEFTTDGFGQLAEDVMIT